MQILPAAEEMYDWLTEPVNRSKNSPYTPYGPSVTLENHPEFNWNIGVYNRNKDAIGAGLVFAVNSVAGIIFMCLGILRVNAPHQQVWKVLSLHCKLLDFFICATSHVFSSQGSLRMDRNSIRKPALMNSRCTLYH